MSSRGRKIEKPLINNKLTYGDIISWKFRQSITPLKNSYCFRFEVTFQNGNTEKMQRGGFSTIAEANKAKELAIASLYKHEFVPYSFTVKEIYDYWLYYYLLDERKVSYSTYMSYRNIIYNYLLPVWGEDTKMEEIDRVKLNDALKLFVSDSMFDSACGVLRTSFQFAKDRNFIYIDAVKGAVKAARNERKKKKEQKEAEQAEDFMCPDNGPVLSAEQAALVLYKSKIKEPKIYIPLLLTITAGLRISEALAVRFCDIDFGKKELHFTKQIGRSTTDDGLESDNLCFQLMEPKTHNGIRVIPLADFVLDEIVLARKRYEMVRSITPDFYDMGFVNCQMSGKPYDRTYMYKPYKRVLEECGIPFIRWHNLRHTYATLLAQHGVNMKAISVCMGHFCEDFTQKVYIAQQKIVYDAVEEIQPFIDEVLPKSEKQILELVGEKYILEVVPKSAYND